MMLLVPPPSPSTASSVDDTLDTQAETAYEDRMATKKKKTTKKPAKAATATSKAPKAPSNHLTCAEVAERAGVSQRTVRRAVVSGGLTGARTATGVIVVPSDEAKRWIAARGKLTPVKPER